MSASAHGCDVENEVGGTTSFGWAVAARHGRRESPSIPATRGDPAPRDRRTAGLAEALAEVRARAR
jgi:hypothetical protein